MDPYTYWLDRVQVIKKREKFLLLKEFESGENIYKASMCELAGVLGDIVKAQELLNQKDDKEIYKNYEQLMEMKIRFFNFMEEGFPERLRTIPDPPLNLYYLGGLPEEKVLSVAVIGARECSEYGHYVARELGKYLGENGVQVISGMARGIDGISQQAALEGGGTSYGVLGCSVDICYPKENKDLYDQLIENGGVLSTYYPVTAPKPTLFPPRNRIVSGLADAIVVVEARQKSGTLITVDMALEQAREVFVVPGRVTDRLSDGCNQLLKDGARVFLTPGEFVNTLLEDFPEKKCKKGKRNQKDILEQEECDLTQEEKAVYHCLDFYPVSMEQIRRRLMELGQEKYAREVPSILIKLCMRGVCKQMSAGWFQKENTIEKN